MLVGVYVDYSFEGLFGEFSFESLFGRSSCCRLCLFGYLAWHGVSLL